MTRKNKKATVQDFSQMQPARSLAALRPQELTFIDWARLQLRPLDEARRTGHRDDLEPIGEMIADAKVVAFGEAVHGGAEPLEFRNRLLQYLVERKGFTAIAIESGIVESRTLHDYVRGAPGDLDKALAQGITWTFDQLPQNRELVQWLREYNADPRHVRKVNFYGFDVPGSPANPQATRGHATGLLSALDFLSSVDPLAGALFHTRLDALAARMGFFFRGAVHSEGYAQLAPAERDALTAGIADLISLLERNEAKYSLASTPNDYAWGYRMAIGARQMDNWLRQIPIGWETPSESAPFTTHELDFMCGAAQARDRAQADNLDWILRKEGASAKVLVFAHNAHLSSAAVGWRPTGDILELQGAGTYLRNRLQEQLVTIGNLRGRGEVRCGDYEERLQPAAADTLDYVVAKLGSPRFLLDLRSAPSGIRNWLDQTHRYAHSAGVCNLLSGNAFDILLYLDAITPACSATAQECREAARALSNV